MSQDSSELLRQMSKSVWCICSHHQNSHGEGGCHRCGCDEFDAKSNYDEESNMEKEPSEYKRGLITALEIARSEPNLPGHMPPEMRSKITERINKGEAEEVIRIFSGSSGRSSRGSNASSRR